MRRRRKAADDVSINGEKFGGDYVPGKIPEIPAEVLASFYSQQAIISDAPMTVRESR
jgi:hypothetical protein